jgi:hypothetical protein
LAGYTVLTSNVTCMILTICFIKCSSWPAELVEHRRFKAHEETEIHRKKTRRRIEVGQQTIKPLPLSQSLDDPLIWTRIQVAHTLACHDIAIDQFGNMLDSHLLCAGYQPAQHYRDSKAAWQITVMISLYQISQEGYDR